jgi:hypothetical protein
MRLSSWRVLGDLSLTLLQSVNHEKRKNFPFSILDLTFVIARKSHNVYREISGLSPAMSNIKSHMENGKCFPSLLRDLPTVEDFHSSLTQTFLKRTGWP